MQIAPDSKHLPKAIHEAMEKYRTELLQFNMQEPIKRQSSVWHWHFYKPMTDLTAFVVNLTGKDEYIQITYGYASTAFTRCSGDENTLDEWGISDESVTLREKIHIHDANDEQIAKDKIAQMYERYAQTQKDDLLLVAKNKQKEFIQQIASKLKPLGFKKKANTWTRILEDEYYLMFNVQKSAFSDECYFNIYIGKNGTNDYGDCYYTRIAPQEMYPLDWQSISKEDFDLFLEKIAIPMFQNIIATPLSQLGKVPSYWKGCTCNHTKCQQCWMEKNLWEAKE